MDDGSEFRYISVTKYWQQATAGGGLHHQTTMVSQSDSVHLDQCYLIVN